MTSPACDRVFAIDELVIVILEQADTLALVNCQRVCRLWKSIIDSSSRLQEELFLIPDAHRSSPRLNSVLQACFKQALGVTETIDLPRGKHAYRTDQCCYNYLQKLPWARDGYAVDARSRRAFARKEASWRRMLVSQPPIEQLDWWQEWQSTNVNHLGYPVSSGDSNEYAMPSPITIGKLWDILEGRLLRGCITQITYFLSACAAHRDPTASAREQKLQQDLAQRDAHRQYIDWRRPRIRVCSTLTWPGDGPAAYESFDVPSYAWKPKEEIPAVSEPRRRATDKERYGIFLLKRDCARDSQDENRRWSRSDAFERQALRLGNASHAGRGPRAVIGHTSE